MMGRSEPGKMGKEIPYVSPGAGVGPSVSVTKKFFGSNTNVGQNKKQKTKRKSLYSTRRKVRLFVLIYVRFFFPDKTLIDPFYLQREHD